LVFSLASSERRKKLSEEARRSRASVWGRRFALFIVIIYNLVGLTDIASTTIALDRGAGVEANPFLATLMTHAGEGWILAKIALQGVISFMVLWFPHWIVLSFFTVATVGNAWVVANNFSIAGVL